MFLPNDDHHEINHWNQLWFGYEMRRESSYFHYTNYMQALQMYSYVKVFILSKDKWPTNLNTVCPHIYKTEILNYFN